MLAKIGGDEKSLKVFSSAPNFAVFLISPGRGRGDENYTSRMSRINSISESYVIITLIMPVTAITAMQLRQSPGRILDRVFYKNESIVIERSGEPMAAVVPLSDYEKIQALKTKAKESLFSRIDALREKVEEQDISQLKKDLKEAMAEISSD